MLGNEEEKVWSSKEVQGFEKYFLLLNSCKSVLATFSDASSSNDNSMRNQTNSMLGKILNFCIILINIQQSLCAKKRLS